ncbi:MAG: PH domain-containing protein [Eggerthellaceae bacterium]
MKHQVHHSYMWLGSIRVGLSILFAYAIALISVFIQFFAKGGTRGAYTESLDFVISAICLVGTFVLVVGTMVVYQVISYKHLYFTLSDTEFSLYKGIISKKRVHVPYYRVQSVDQRASLLQRIFGVCTVMIDTAGGSSNKAVIVPYLTRQQAEWLRSELFSRKRGIQQAQRAKAAVSSGAVSVQDGLGAVPEGSGNVLDFGAQVWEEYGGLFGGDEVETGKVSFEYGLSNKELLFTGISNNTSFLLVLFAILGAIGQIAQVLFGVFPKQGGDFAHDMVVHATGSAAIGFFALVAGSVFVAMLVVWIISALAACIGYGGFRARRRDSRIETEHGLLQHTFQGVDIDRVQAVVVKQGFIRRLMGYCELSLAKVDAASANDDSSKSAQQGQHGIVIHPFVKVSRMPEILQGLLPEFQDAPEGLTPMPSASLRRGLIRRCIWQGSGFWLAVCVTAALVAINGLCGVQGFASALDVSSEYAAMILRIVNYCCAALYVFAIVAAVLEAVGCVLWFHESGFSFNERYMRLVNGGFSKTEYCIPRQKIQYLKLRTNPFQRRSKVATLMVRTAAGVGGTTVRLLDVAQSDGSDWLAWGEPKPHTGRSTGA